MFSFSTGELFNVHTIRHFDYASPPCGAFVPGSHWDSIRPGSTLSEKSWIRPRKWRFKRQNSVCANCSHAFRIPSTRYRTRADDFFPPESHHYSGVHCARGLTLGEISLDVRNAPNVQPTGVGLPFVLPPPSLPASPPRRRATPLGVWSQSQTWLDCSMSNPPNSVHPITRSWQSDAVQFVSRPDCNLLMHTSAVAV